MLFKVLVYLYMQKICGKVVSGKEMEQVLTIFPETFSSQAVELHYLNQFNCCINSQIVIFSYFITSLIIKQFMFDFL